MLVAPACSTPPLGRARWTLELLAGEWVRLIDPAMVSRETIPRRLAENELTGWQLERWCIRNRGGSIWPGRPSEPVDSPVLRY
jgi:hypothetical protein